MKYFKRVRAGVDPEPFLSEIAAVGDAWGMVTGRQDKIAVQREALAIPLRGLRRGQIHGRNRSEVHESRWTSASIRTSTGAATPDCAGARRRLTPA